MASIFDNLELGWAGVTDLVGLTHDHAAEVFTEQSTPSTATAEERARILTNATATEDAGGVEQAALNTAHQVADAGKAVVGGLWDGLKTPLILAVVGLGAVVLLVYAPEAKAIAKRVLG